MVARQLLREVGGFDEAMRSGEDYDLWMRLALRSPVALVDEPLVDVRRHDHNHSRDWAIAFDGRDRSLAKLQSAVDPGRRALLRRERARNGARLVAEHASARRASRGPERLRGQRRLLVVLPGVVVALAARRRRQLPAEQAASVTEIFEGRRHLQQEAREAAPAVDQ